MSRRSEEPAEESSPAYRVRLTDSAEAGIDEGYGWMLRFGFEAAERWLKGLQEAIAREATQRATLPGFRGLAPDADRFPGRAMYQFLYRTSGGSPWRILYELADENGDGRTDTLVVAYVRHAARKSAEDSE